MLSFFHDESHDRSKDALKSSRKIELGWMHDGKQLRKCSDGATRVLEVSKNSTKKDILSHAKELFFPGGESKKGKWEDFLHVFLTRRNHTLMRAVPLVSCTQCQNFASEIILCCPFRW